MGGRTLDPSSSGRFVRPLVDPSEANTGPKERRKRSEEKEQNVTSIVEEREENSSSSPSKVDDAIRNKMEEWEKKHKEKRSKFRLIFVQTTAL